MPKKLTSSIFFADGQSANVVFTPANKEQLKGVNQDFGVARCGVNDPKQVRFTYGGLSKADRVSRLYVIKAVGKSYYKKYTANNASYIFTCSSEDAAKKFRNAVNAVRSLWPLIADTPTSTGDSQYANAGGKYYYSTVGNYTAAYRVPYSASKNQDNVTAATNDNSAAHLRQEAAEADNKAATLAADTEQKKASTTTSKVMRYAAVAVVVIAAIFVIVKLKKK